MNYLEIEIDEEIEKHGFLVSKLREEELRSLISFLNTRFFEGGEGLDSSKMCVTSKEHDPFFWKKIKYLGWEGAVLIVFDISWHGWRFSSIEQVELLLSETTGYPFWLANSNGCELIFFDDHDCVGRSIVNI
ncbi:MULTISPECIES: hypothetical protein [unclassified Pseudomonas]|uniref:hypothetical protein n=1 Tax=unclassified Pseudomonas TaxID=196821 RepID=UPI0007ED5F1F|nr:MULTISPECIES: hypothetical protein [unclassified Pseudomonas]OBP07746.1 hypothetical protein BAE52_26690 [Pseudomonas sp. EGD-AKN5]QOF86769.1 hypothetical protein IG194_08855 [Pseudomonas sp. ADPe]